VTVSVEVDGEERTRTVDTVPADEDTVTSDDDTVPSDEDTVPSDDDTATRRESGPAAELESTLSFPTGNGPRYEFYHDGDAAVFVPGNLSDYRESLEAKYSAAPEAAGQLAQRAYARHAGDDPPDETTAAIARLPSMTETVERLTTEMAEFGTETLVVDLRDNPGGDSQFVFHLAYALGGWDAVARTTEQVRLLRRRTEPYQQRYGVGGDSADGDGEDAGSGGDGLSSPESYDFTAFFRGEEASDGLDPVQFVRQRLARSETATAFTERVDDAGIYCPDRLVVAVSAETMSSAFAGVAQLTSLDATVVGVPSGQAPVSFGEPVDLPLPNTGLDVRLSGSMYHWLEDADDDVLEPDCVLTPERFEQHDTAADATLRLALTSAGHEPPNTEPTTPS
jgi:hypothetical protein